MESTDRALRAALAVAREQGIRATDPRVVRDMTNVLVHLAPAPVVARVPVTLAKLRPPSWFAREVELAGFLAGAGAPAAPPAREVDPGPHTSDGMVVSLWQLVDHDVSRFDATEAGAALRALHTALAAYRGELPRCERLDEVELLLGILEPSELLLPARRPLRALTITWTNARRQTHRTTTPDGSPEGRCGVLGCRRSVDGRLPTEDTT